MIVVRIELWPGGDRTRSRDLGTAYIVNDGSGGRTLGSYDVMLSMWGKPTVPWRVGRVAGFQRLKGSPWDLLRRAIVAASGSRPGSNPTLQTKMTRVARRAQTGQATFMEEGRDDDLTDASEDPDAAWSEPEQ